MSNDDGSSTPVAELSDADLLELLRYGFVSSDTPLDAVRDRLILEQQIRAMGLSSKKED